jgi:FkbM family methyltransferase
MAKSVIFDLGANNGDDTAYYLKKADRVIAVEANPDLCAVIRARFAEELDAGRLVVENAVLTAEHGKPNAIFHLHRSNHVLSQFPPPEAHEAADFEAVELPALSVAELLRRHGEPHYVKMDLEHYDGAVLGALFAGGVFPDYISAEAHDMEVFQIMVAAGYKAFKLVDGRTVPERYGEHFIMTAFSRELHAFPRHSAGPYGNDIPGPWMTVDDFQALLRVVGFGWKDIHASRRDETGPGIPRWLLPVR